MFEHSLWFHLLREHTPGFGTGTWFPSALGDLLDVLEINKVTGWKDFKNIVWLLFGFDSAAFLLFVSVEVGASYTSYTLYFTRSIPLKNKQLWLI